MIQGSTEWFAARLGKVTASRVCDVVAKTKTGWGASRASYAAELIAERLTGERVDGYSNAAMDWGVIREPEALAAYAWQTDADVAPIGFAEHPCIGFSGASPDGLVAPDGLVEVKCPNTATHIATLLGGKIPDKYQVQMLWQMACAEKEWCDFVSFDPRMPPEMRLFVKRLDRDDKRIAELEEQVAEFLAEVAGKVADLRRLYNLPEPEAQARRWEDLALQARAGIRCGEAAFQKWLGVSSEEEAIAAVYKRCGIGSRKDLDADQRAAGEWGIIETEYWMATRGYEAA